uniref:ATP synthase subunit a n=1 Tax=Mirax sp. QL-2014 TaxID=1491721 RepID=A0A0U1WYK4_9HYME|nr:ATP synthase F0 subunit 6 [Mirax sp. QL-2014]
MLNLFSIFDPSTNLFYSMNWISSFLWILLLPQIYWLMNSRFYKFMMILMKSLWNEFKVIMKVKFNMNNMLYLLSLFMFILLNNFMGLFPYLFTSSSHLMFSLSISLSMWIGFMLFGWLKNTTFMFVHLVPMGTPFILMFFMVMIEMLSNLIRPMTLSIRLVANMVAGHLLLTLLGGFISKFLMIYMLMVIVQLLLLFLEMVVSFIQAYVFIILMLLYLKETN